MKVSTIRNSVPSGLSSQVLKKRVNPSLCDTFQAIRQPMLGCSVTHAFSGVPSCIQGIAATRASDMGQTLPGRLWV